MSLVPTVLGGRPPKSKDVVKVDIQRELLLTGCAIEETKRKQRHREQHIKDLIARVQASHEEKKKRNIGLTNRQTKQTTVRATLFQFPGETSSSFRHAALSRSNSTPGAPVDYQVYKTKKPSSAFFTNSTYNRGRSGRSASRRKQALASQRSQRPASTQVGSFGVGSSSQCQQPSSSSARASSARRAMYYFGGLHASERKEKRPQSARR